MCGSGSGSVFRIRIRIQEAPEYGSDTDPDPQHCPGGETFQEKTEKMQGKWKKIVIYL